MIRNLWPLLIGFSIWAVAFLAIYSLQALGCVWGWDAGLHRTTLVALALLFIATLIGLLFWQHRARRRPACLPEMAGFWLTGLALAASVVTFAPVGFATLCQ